MTRALALVLLLIAPAAAHAAAEGAWREIPPLTRAGQSLLYDAARDQVVMFGGWDGDEFHNDVWVLSLSTGGAWTRLDAAGPAPSPRIGCAAVLDSIGDRMVIFGGASNWSGSAALGDMWALSLGPSPAWTRLAAGRTSPSARGWAASCLDAVTRRMIIAGGSTLPGSDAWSFDLSADTAWTPLATIGWARDPQYPHPWPKWTAGGSYDRTHAGMIAWGDSLWILTLSGTPRWMLLDGGPRPASAIFYDSRLPRMVGVGPGDVQVEAFPPDLNDYYSASPPGWDALVPTAGRPTSFVATESSVYDPVRERVLMVGGETTESGCTWVSSATWAVPLSGPSGWTSLSGDLGGPQPRFFPTVAFDPTGNRLFVSGFDGCIDQFAEPWRMWSLSLDTHLWTVFADSGVSIPGGNGGISVWDPIRQRLLVIEGNGVWSLPPAAGQAWPLIAPAPPGQWSKVLDCAYDPARDQLIASTPPASSLSNGPQLWVLPLNAPSSWTKLGAPVPGSGPMILDPSADRMVMFASVDSTGHAGNLTWQLPLASPGSWQLVPIGSAPPIGFGARSAIYDPIRGRMIVIGPGPPDWTTLTEWALPLDGSRDWTQLQPGPGAVYSTQTRATYDPIQDRMLVFDTGSFAMRLWALEWGSIATAVEVSVMEAGAIDGRVQVAWRVATAGAVCSVERAIAESGPWSVVARTAADGVGRVSYGDTAVEPGARYGYRLRVGAEVGGVVWVEVPSSLVFTIEPPRPNPTAGGLVLSVTLPDAAPATLDVVDIAGRRVAARDVGELGAGKHTIQLSRSGELRPGLYFVRLRRGTRSLAIRACLTQ